MGYDQEKPAWMQDDLADRRIQKKASEVEGLLAQLRAEQQRALLPPELDHLGLEKDG